MPMEPLSRQELQLFYDVATSVYAIRDLDTLLASILSTIKAAFQIEGASIALHDSQSCEFYFIQTLEEQRDGHHQDKERMRFADHLGVAGWVLSHGRPALIADTAKDERFYKGIDQQENFETRSMICLPLTTREGLVGILYALNKCSGTFSSQDVMLLEVVCGVIAVAIENAMLYGELRQQTDHLVHENRLLRSEVRRRFSTFSVVGSSAAMRQVFRLIEKVIATSATVLIHGETGTGKELIAKVIHYNGPQAEKVFVAENCAALSESLLESELFGHVKGAFTGAVNDKKGLFEMADGGTLFLDEIGEMPMTMQAKLLRVLQEGTIRPVGASHTKQVDVRLIACTNRDLEAAVNEGTFRKDLYYRINVFPIHMPPLRERKEDIILLAAHFLRQFAKKLDWTEPRLTATAVQQLMAYQWPGNVRELENEMERALAMAGPGQAISEAMLSGHLQESGLATVPPLAGERDLHAVVRQVEIQMIAEVLKETSGNRSESARRLGLTRQGLINKIARYDIRI